MFERTTYIAIQLVILHSPDQILHLDAAIIFHLLSILYHDINVNIVKSKNIKRTTIEVEVYVFFAGILLLSLMYSGSHSGILSPFIVS